MYWQLQTKNRNQISLSEIIPHINNAYASKDSYHQNTFLKCVNVSACITFLFCMTEVPTISVPLFRVACAHIPVEATEDPLARVGSAVLTHVLPPRHVCHLGGWVVVRELRATTCLMTTRHVLLLYEVIVCCKVKTVTVNVCNRWKPGMLSCSHY